MSVFAPSPGTFTGDWSADIVATQTVVMQPGSQTRPAAVSVVAATQGAVKGCGPGTVVFHGLVTDFPTQEKGVAGRGTWTLVPGSGTAGFAGASGSGTMVQTVNPDFSTKAITHSGTITCRAV